MAYLVYRTELSEFMSDCVGHVNSQGEVYRTPYTEDPWDCVGHVNSRGQIFTSRASETVSDYAGHVNTRGEIYSHISSEYTTDRAGHVNSSARIYRTHAEGFWEETSSDALGHVSGDCPQNLAGGAGYLLLVRGNAGNSYSGSQGGGNSSSNVSNVTTPLWFFYLVFGAIALVPALLFPSLLPFYPLVLDFYLAFSESSPYANYCRRHGRPSFGEVGQATRAAAPSALLYTAAVTVISILLGLIFLPGPYLIPILLMFAVVHFSMCLIHIRSKMLRGVMPMSGSGVR